VLDRWPTRGLNVLSSDGIAFLRFVQGLSKAYLDSSTWISHAVVPKSESDL
jgi:hypothetical protein